MDARHFIQIQPGPSSVWAALVSLLSTSIFCCSLARHKQLSPAHLDKLYRRQTWKSLLVPLLWILLHKPNQTISLLTSLLMMFPQQKGCASRMILVGFERRQ